MSLYTLKKAFERVWHLAHWSTMKLYNINTDLTRAIQNLYSNSPSAVNLNGSVRELFRTTDGVRQGCLLPPTLFNIFLERITIEASEDHVGSVSIGGRTIIYLRFADDIDGPGGSGEESAKLVERLDRTSGIEISAGKNKLMTSNNNGIGTVIKANCEKLESV